MKRITIRVLLSAFIVMTGCMPFRNLMVVPIDETTHKEIDGPIDATVFSRAADDESQQKPTTQPIFVNRKVQLVSASGLSSRVVLRPGDLMVIDYPSYARARVKLSSNASFAKISYLSASEPLIMAIDPLLLFVDDRTAREIPVTALDTLFVPMRK